MNPGERLKAQEQLATALLEALSTRLQLRGNLPADLVCVLMIALTYAELGADHGRQNLIKKTRIATPEQAAMLAELEQEAIALAKEFCDELRTEIQKEDADARAATVV